MAGKVRCADCGYLAIRNIQTRQLMEVESGIRNGSNFPSRTEGFGSASHLVAIYEPYPICFRMEESLENDLSNIGNFSQNRTIGIADFSVIIERDRDCESFTEWKQGWMPKEHLEMIISEKLLFEQREWQAGQAKLADERHSDSMKIANDAKNAAMKGAYLGAFSTVIAGLLAVWATLRGESPSQPSAAPVVNVIVPEQRAPQGAVPASPYISAPNTTKEQVDALPEDVTPSEQH